MDPDAAMADFLNFAFEGEYDQAEERAEALQVWIQKGGFMPDVSRRALNTLLTLARAQLSRNAEALRWGESMPDIDY